MNPGWPLSFYYVRISVYEGVKINLVEVVRVRLSEAFPVWILEDQKDDVSKGLGVRRIQRHFTFTTIDKENDIIWGSFFFFLDGNEQE